jgi:Aspartyl protease/Tetratricopeptide repeat
MTRLASVQADQTFAEGRLAEALNLYNHVAGTDPGNARAWARLGTLALWKNDLPAAESYLKRSTRAQAWWARRWPMNIDLQTSLAYTCARGGRMAEAAALLLEAAGPLPLGPLKELLVRGRQAALFTGGAPYRIEGGAQAALPFVITDPLPVVKVAVNGAEPANFIIDTGGEGLVLDAEFAQRVGADIVGEVSGEYAGGKKGKTGFGKVDKVGLGSLLMHEVPVSRIDLRPIAQSIFPGLGINGVVGTGVLMQFLSTIDYAQQQLVLRPRSGATERVDRLLGITAQDVVIPMWLVQTHLIFAEGSINALEPAMMLIDTGLADAGFLAPKSVFAAAGVVMDWSNASMGAGGGGMTKALGVQVGEVTLAHGASSLRRRDLKGVVFENDPSLFSGALGFRVGGLVSHEYFRSLALTFDFDGMRMVLQPSRS